MWCWSHCVSYLNRLSLSYICPLGLSCSSPACSRIPNMSWIMRHGFSHVSLLTYAQKTMHLICRCLHVSSNIQLRDSYVSFVNQIAVFTAAICLNTLHVDMHTYIELYVVHLHFPSTHTFYMLLWSTSFRWSSLHSAVYMLGFALVLIVVPWQAWKTTHHRDPSSSADAAHAHAHM